MNEPFPGFLVRDKLRQKEAKRHGALRLRFLHLIDNTHATFTKLLEDLLVGYCLTDHHGRISVQTKIRRRILR
jgi:hypothetical protein